MATLFADIYNSFVKSTIRDANLTSLYTPDLLSELFADWLLSAREVFYEYVFNNVGETTNKVVDAIESTRETYSYSFAGVSDTRALSPAPTTGSSFYVSVNGVAWTDYSFNTLTNEMTISNADVGDNSVYIGAYTDGQFNQTLSPIERRIILKLMQLVYYDTQTTNEKLLNQRVYGKDYGMHSQASHIQAIDKLEDNRYKRVMGEIYWYTYISNPDDLEGLGGAGE